jgi:23S rRNA (cytidine2498-2'-O)-methyltransferase
MSITNNSQFLYFSCQHGAENFIKSQWCEPRGPFRIAYSGKGFLTLKSQMALPIWSRALPEDPLVRSRGFILGKIEGTDASELAEKAIEQAKDMDWQIMHVWERDRHPVGWRGFEPGRSEIAKQIALQFRQKLDASQDSRTVVAHGLDASVEDRTKTPPKSNSNRVFEVIVDTPNRWWLAAKAIQTRYDRWPGGVPDLQIRQHVISRAYYKMAEAFAWAGFQIRPKERIVEIGSAPGGACQWLLEQGASVTGIDPAEMNVDILQHPNFTHWRSRSLQVKRRAFSSFRILVCDANVTPNYTLDTVEAVVSYPTSNFRGLILTIKLPEWEHASEISSHLERVRSWGFERVEARQLAHNRREYCLAARKRQAREGGDGPVSH